MLTKVCTGSFPGRIECGEADAVQWGEFAVVEPAEIWLTRIYPGGIPEGGDCKNRLPHPAFHHPLQQFIILQGIGGGILLNQDAITRFKGKATVGGPLPGEFLLQSQHGIGRRELADGSDSLEDAHRLGCLQAMMFTPPSMYCVAPDSRRA